MVVDITDCDFECAIDFTWIEIDSIICEGDFATFQYNSNARNITIDSQIYHSDSFSISGLTTDTCIHITATYDAFCDTSFIQCIQVIPGIKYDQLSFENIVCRGNTSTLTYTTDADIIELLDNSSNLISTGNNGIITTPSILNDTTFYLRLGRLDGNCERSLPLEIFIDSEIYQEVDTLYQCWNDSIIINDIIVSLEGSYNWPLLSVDNCDSLYQLEIIHFPISPTDSIISFSCDVSDTMTIWSTYLNGDGCESLRFSQTRLSSSSISMLQDTNCDTTFAGLDTITLQNYLGCDSLVIKTTIWMPPSSYDTIIRFCEGDTLFIENEVYSEEGMFDFISNTSAASGCDSTVAMTLEYEVNPQSDLIIGQLCTGDTLFIENEIYTDEGLYEFVSDTQAVSGCDSIISVSIDYYSNAASEMSNTICSGDSVVIANQSFAASGFYDVLIENGSINGCDSIVYLELTILQHAEIDTTFHLCSGESLLFMGSSFDEQNPSGYVSVPFQNFECDSISFNVILEFQEVNLSVDVIDAFCGEKYGVVILDLDENITQLFLDGNQLNIDSDSITMLSTKQYSLKAADEYGCSDSLDFEIFSAKDLILDYPDTLFLYINQQVQIDILSNQELIYVEWEIEQYDCISEDCGIINFTALSEDPITATVTSVDGCTQLVTIEVELEKVLSFPIANIFSPNGDGVNDKWVLDFSESDLIPIDIMVFDRWANKVYDTNFDSRFNIRSWDGLHRNRKVVNGVYVYYFRYWYEGKQQYKTGSITVID
jgi:gliding motility-associated-like protein